MLALLCASLDVVWIMLLLCQDPFADVCLEECSLGVGSNTSNEESSRFRSQLSSPLPEKFTITLFSNRDGATSPTQPQTSLTVSGKDEKVTHTRHGDTALHRYNYYECPVKGEVKAKIKISPVVVFGVLSRMVLVRES